LSTCAASLLSIAGCTSKALHHAAREPQQVQHLKLGQFDVGNVAEKVLGAAAWHLMFSSAALWVMMSMQAQADCAACTPGELHFFVIPPAAATSCHLC
jgi:hypothetical protein